MVVGVYVGYDRPRPRGKRETGSTNAVPISVNSLKTQWLIVLRYHLDVLMGRNLFPIDVLAANAAFKARKMLLSKPLTLQRLLVKGEQTSVIDVPGAQSSTDTKVLGKAFTNPNGDQN